MTTERAIIYIPAELPYDGRFAQQCLDHIERRGYEMSYVLRDWFQVIHVLHERLADVVVMARREHMPAELTPRFEFAGARDVAPNRRPEPIPGQARRAGGRHRRPTAI